MDFQINNMGATISGVKNTDGTYKVITQGTKCGSKPIVENMSAQEVAQKYGKFLDKTPTTDVFQKSKLMDVVTQINDYNCKINPYMAMMHYQQENFKNAIDFIKTGELPSSDMGHTMATWNPAYAWMLYNTEKQH